MRGVTPSIPGTTVERPEAAVALAAVRAAALVCRAVRSDFDARLATAKVEIDRWRDYDYVLVNDDLQRTFARLRAILVSERLRRERQTGLPAFVKGLLADL